jgi:DNA-binding transcriptional MerR regulator
MSSVIHEQPATQRRPAGQYWFVGLMLEEIREVLLLKDDG